VPRIILLVIGAPMTAGYCALMIGVSRLLFGAAAESKSFLMGLVRLVFGLVFTLALIVLVMMLAIVGISRHAHG
jgi:formate/nitrite transporter FocA (FNT family)